MAEATAKQIEVAAAAYKPCSVRAAILYFVLNDLAGVDPMYQFSLDAYNDLFLISIQKSVKNDKLEERIKNLNDYHTYAVYKYTSRSAQSFASFVFCCYLLCLFLHSCCNSGLSSVLCCEAMSWNREGKATAHMSKQWQKEYHE